MIVFLIAVLVLAISTYLHLKKRRDIIEPPLYPGSLPIIGHTLMIVAAGTKRGLIEHIKEISNTVLENGEAVAVSWLGFKLYVLNNPEDCNTIANFSYEKATAYGFSKPWLGNALICAPVSIWKHNRRLLNRAFNQQVLDGFISIFNAQSKNLVRSMEVEVGKGGFDHYHYIEHSSLKTVCKTVLGTTTDINNLIDIDNYLKAVVNIHECFTRRATNPIYYLQFFYNFTNLKKRSDEIIQFLHSSVMQMIRHRKTFLINNTQVEGETESKFTSLLDVLLKFEEDNSITEEQIMYELNGFIAAAYETSACTLFHTLVLIGSFPEVQERVYKELSDVLDPDRDVDKKVIARLTYLDAVIKEASRYVTVVPIIGRRVTEDVKLRNYTLPAGSECLLDVMGLHNHPVWGKDRHEFRPERWLDSSKLPEYATAFSAFGLGRRGCIGKMYAQMYMKIALANILRHYRVVGDYTKVKIEFNIVAIPNPGQHLTIFRR